jgi:hypothetical protein
MVCVIGLNRGGTRKKTPGFINEYCRSQLCAPRRAACLSPTTTEGAFVVKLVARTGVWNLFCTYFFKHIPYRVILDHNSFV